MRIVYLNPVGCLGGAERVLLAVMAGAMRVDPSLDAHLIASTDGPLFQLAESLGVRTVLLPMPETLAAAGDTRLRDSRWWARPYSILQEVGKAPDVWRYICKLQALLRSIAPDLIHSNGIKTHLLARFAATAPVVWHMHDFYGERPLVQRMLRWARKGVKGAITISEAIDRDTKSLLPDLPTCVVPNAIDVQRFAPATPEPELLDRLAGLLTAEEGTIRVGLVATYARWKGQDVFLKAAARVVEKQPEVPVRFYLIGGPIYRTEGSQFSLVELRALANSLGLQGHLGFISFQQNTADLYRALDIVVHASTRPEPFGLTIIEAMACARAVIVTQAGGAAELFTHDQDAIGVAPGDVSALAQAIDSLVGNSVRRQRLSEYARRTAVHRFDQARLGPQIIDAYRTFLRSGSDREISLDRADMINGTNIPSLAASESSRNEPLIRQER